MAVFRATKYWRAMLSGMGGGGGGNMLNSNYSSSRMYAAATSTVPKMKPFVPTADAHIHHHQQQQQHSKPSKSSKAGEFIPIYVVMGLVMVAISFGVHTAKQQFRYAPSVHVSKKKRETMPEVEEPDHVLGEADKFIHKSFFRKVAHIQQEQDQHTIPDPIRGDVFTAR